MASSVEGGSIPDCVSIDQNEDMSEDCRMERDSSNDENMFEDSSGEETEATCGLSDGVPSVSNSKNSKTDKVDSENPLPIEAANSTAVVSLQKSSAALDEECLVPISEEEQDFFERFRDANQAQLASLKCTTCSCQLFLVNRDNIRIHPVLGVLVCKSCREFYSNGPFTKDENGHDEYCRWCAEGGMMICCDTCSNVFCKACLRRCIGRANLLEITSSKCNWSCLVCNNNPLWTQRALCRMVIGAMKSAVSRRSIGRSMLNSPTTGDATDPAIWLPSIISEAEKLATYCKILATKVGNSWSKDCADSGGEGSSSGRRDKETDKLKVINCCRKLRKAVTTTRFNMKLLEKRMVTKYEQKYGNATDIDVEMRSEAASSKRESSPRLGKRLIVKFKNFREGTNKEDYYAEVRESPTPTSSPSLTSKPVKPSPVKSTESISSMVTLAQANSPLPVIEQSSDDDLPTQPIQAEEIQLPTVDDSPTNDDADQFFDTCSDVVDNKQTEEGNSCSSGLFGAKSESKTRSPNTLKNTRADDDSDSDATPTILPLYLSVTDDEVTNSDRKSTVKEEAKSATPSPVFDTSDVTVSPERNNVGHAAKTPVEVKSEKKPFKSKLSRTRTPSSKERASRIHPSSASKDEVAAKPSSKTSTPDDSSNPKNPKSTPVSSMDANEKARRALLADSTDSDDSLAEIELSPRVKRTKKRERGPLDDPKLKAECEVVVQRLSDLDEALALENGKGVGTKESTLAKQIDRLAKNPIKITIKTVVSESEEEKSDKTTTLAEKPKPKSKKANLAKNIYSSSSSSSSDSDNESASAMQVAGVNKQPVATSLPDLNDAARQALLASSDSEADFDMDTNDNVNTPDEIVEEKSTDEGDVIEESEVDANGLEEVKVEDITEEDEENVGAKTSNLKTSKLLRVSLADPEADSDTKSQKGKEPKGEKKKKPKERKKRRIQSDSDFESSDSEKDKKKRKKKRSSPSDVEEISDDDDSGGEVKQKSKPRRRIKKTAASDSQDSDDSDVQVLNESQRSEAGASKGRKNIKKIMKDTNLKDETKKAAKEEEDRKKRIAERQKFYNEAFVGDMALINKMTDHLVLDFDPKTKEELVTVDKQIVTKLKPHQVKGVKFMWDACFESIERIKEHPGSGCILAHCMGLGKSLQVVTLVHTVLTHKACQVDRVLVVCPLSTVLNWVNEFRVWLPKDTDVEVYELASVKANAKDLRVYTLRNWFEGGGVMIIGYDMYRNLTNENNKRIKSKARDVFLRSLVDPGPQLVVCDEGHLLKNETTALSKAMNRIATRRRVVLTGTPLQNSLLEYHCMIQFVKPNLLGTKKEFTNRFANPIKNGQAADSTDGDVRVMKRRAHVLHKMLEDSVQRFDYAVLTPFLPPKHEYVVSVKMSELQIKMYQYYLEHHAKGGPSHIGRGKGAGLFADFQELGRVWTHPKALLLAELNRDAKAKSHSDSEGSLVDFIDDREDSPLTEEDGGVVCLDESGDEKGSENEEGATRSNGFRMRTRAARGDQPPPEDELGVTTPMSSSWWSQFVTDEDFVKIEHSGKLVLLMDILRQCELIGDKVLVFSQSLVSLNLIEAFLAAEDQQNEQNRQTASLASDIKREKMESIGMWRPNQDYFRLDGQTSPELRKNWCNSFNNPENLRSRLFLISTKAGGLGINLVAANRVIIFDASWNPSHDVQSIFRVYRFGQKKPCYIYRFLAQGTMEEKIYDRQVTKLSLSCRVVDEQQIERHFNSADLNELYVFEPDSHLRRPTPLLPKDRLLAELTIQRKDWIVTYHEHDSLLENKSDEELTEAERKAAWDDFENEKRGVNPMGMMMQDSPGFMGMPGMPDILGGLAGRSVAGIPLSSIAAMIYNSNPGITQDEFLGRLRLTVDQLQNFSVQQAAAAAAASAAAAAAASAQSSLQQPADAQRLLMQRQVAQDQLKRQFGNSPQPTGLAGPSGVGVPPAPPRSRGRPTIGPHQRTDLYGLAPVIYNSATTSNQPGSSDDFPTSGSSSVPKS